ncbi:MAG: glycosyltransferase [Lachnoclostridium sp.]|nr:glycosyltransferase [Lachnoclostridium sp.]
MRIAFAFTWLFNPNVGGTERVTDLLAKELIRRGHCIHYIYTVKRPTDSDYKYPTDKICFIDESIFVSSKGKELLHRYLIDNEVDVVINQGGLMGTCKNFADLPSICKSVTVIHFDPKYGLDSLFSELFTLRNSSFAEKIKRIYRVFAYRSRKKTLKKYLNTLYSYWNCKSDKIVLLSKNYIPDFSKLCPGLYKDKLTAISNPISFPISNNENSKENIILWVGRMDFRQKRPDLMVKIWAKSYSKLPGWKLVMIGGGPMFDSVKKMSKNVPQIELHGQQLSRPYYEKAKICVSSSATEGLPMTLLEAISQGAVPIAFDSFASIHDIIQSDKQLVTPFDINEYVEKLTELACNLEMQEEARANGYEVAERFSLKNIGDEWEKLLYSICDKSLLIG